MNDQSFELMMARFDKIDAALDEARNSFKDHADKDAQYWARLDQQEGQLSVFKWMTGGVSLTAIVAWAWDRFWH